MWCRSSSTIRRRCGDDRSGAGADPELALIKWNAREALREAFRAALEELPVRGKNVLRYQIIDGLGSDEIGRIYRVHRVTVTRWLGRARYQLLRKTRRRLAVAFDLDRGGFESLMGLTHAPPPESAERGARVPRIPQSVPEGR